MYRKHHTKAIVIGGFPTGENSVNTTLFTESFGIINAKAQGIRKLSSRLRLNLQKFSFGEFSLVHGKSGWKLAGAKAVENFYELLKNDSGKLLVMANVLNLIKKLVGEEANHSLFNIVYNFLVFLKTAKKEEVAPAECLVLLRILHSLGYMRSDPELTLPLTSSEIKTADLSLLSPRRAKLVSLINESLKEI